MLMFLVTCVSPTHAVAPHTVTLTQHLSSDHTSMMCITIVCAIFGIMASCLVNMRHDTRTSSAIPATPSKMSTLGHASTAARRLMATLSPTTLGCMLTLGTLSAAALRNANHDSVLVQYPSVVNTLPMIESPFLTTVIGTVALGYSLLLYSFASGTPYYTVCHEIGTAVTNITSCGMQYLVARADQSIYPPTCDDWLGKWIDSAQCYFGRRCGSEIDVQLIDERLKCRSCSKKSLDRKLPEYGYGSTKHPAIDRHTHSPGVVGAIHTVVHDAHLAADAALARIFPDCRSMGMAALAILSMASFVATQSFLTVTHAGFDPTLASVEGSVAYNAASCLGMLTCMTVAMPYTLTKRLQKKSAPPSWPSLPSPSCPPPLPGARLYPYRRDLQQPHMELSTPSRPTYLRMSTITPYQLQCKYPLPSAPRLP